MTPTLHEEEIHEAISDIVVRFHRGRIDPISFRWQRRTHEVVRVNARWTDRNLSPCTHGFTVTVKSGDVFELAYQEGNPVWRLERVFLQ